MPLALKRPLLLASLLALLATASFGSSAGAQAVSAAAIDRAAKARDHFGFKTGKDRIRRLASGRRNPASAEFGFPMSAAEARDLLQRSTFAQRIDRSSLVSLRKLDGYAGAWIDQQDGGRLVVGLTNPRRSIKASVRRRMPAASRGVSFREVDDSARALDAALGRADRVWTSLETGIVPQAFAIHYRHNRVTVKVRQRQLEAARAFKSRMQDRLGVDVGFVASAAITDMAPRSACNSRTRCYGPFRLGTRINFPKAYPNPKVKTFCGMAFHVRERTGAKRNGFLTAGHCTYKRAGPWQHHRDFKSRFGKIGKRIGTKYTTRKRDVAIIEIEDWAANKTTRIYGDNGWSQGARLTAEGRVIEGEILCMSLARTNRVWCGVADATDQWWTSTTANPDIRVRGAAIDFPAGSGRRLSGGDSGSPIYRRWAATIPPHAPRRTPIGIVNAGSRDTPNQQEEHAVYFAKVWWALNDEAAWPGVEILTKPPPPLAKKAFTATWVGTSRKDHRTRLVAKKVEGAKTYRWNLGKGIKPKYGRTVTHRFKNAGEVNVTLTVVYKGGFKRSRKMRIASNPAKTYAPLVYLHPNESYRPTSAESYLASSRLRFAHDAGCAATTIHPGPVSAGKLGSGGYEGNLAVDADCSLPPPPYASDQNTRPGDKANVFPDDEGSEGFYLDVADSKRKGSAQVAAPAYYEYKTGRYVIYWFFYAYNGRGNRHEGDWEHIAVQLDSVGRAQRFAYYRHKCAPKIFKRTRLEKGFGQKGTGLSRKTHPIVYSALRSHASYWKRQSPWKLGAACGLPASSKDSTQKGAAWRTWNSLQNAKGGWYGYGGAWGEDGPLGPSKHLLPRAVPGWW